jgi:cytochrome c
MKIMFNGYLGILALLIAPMAAAQMNSADLYAARSSFHSSGCSSCHTAADSAAGPSLQAIAKRYKGKAVVAELADRIRSGSQGRWGDLPHPAIDYLSQSEAVLMAKWILGGAR